MCFFFIFQKTKKSSFLLLRPGIRIRQKVRVEAAIIQFRTHKICCAENMNGLNQSRMKGYYPHLPVESGCTRCLLQLTLVRVTIIISPSRCCCILFQCVMVQFCLLIIFFPTLFFKVIGAQPTWFAPQHIYSLCSLHLPLSTSWNSVTVSLSQFWLMFLDLQHHPIVILPVAKNYIC